MKTFGPLDHYDYGELDVKCGCVICEDWRRTLKEHREVQPLVSPYYNRGGPTDDSVTRLFMKSRSAYLAAVNRRDTFCEISYHAARMPGGAALMTWIGQQVSDRATKTDWWWEFYGAQVTIGYWLDLYERERSMVNSDVGDISVVCAAV